MDINLQKTKKNSPKGQINWSIQNAPERIDAFNFEEFKVASEELYSDGQRWLAYDFNSTRFLSLMSIIYIAQLADKLMLKGGALALIRPSEKITKQIGIYASLKSITIVDSPSKLS